MDLNDFFGGKPNIIELQATNRWEAIDELVNHLASTCQIKPEHVAAVVAAVSKRESSMSTGIGSGIGLPHAATELVSDPVWALGRSQRGIQFDAIDFRPVTLVMLYLVPKGEFQKHLYTLANIAKLLHRFNSPLT